MDRRIACSPKQLPRALWVDAAAAAVRINPVNHPHLDRLALVLRGIAPTPEAIAVVTTKYWHTNGVDLAVGFLDSPPAALRSRILANMNAWGTRANVRFIEAKTDPMVRIARKTGDGYWSYVGTDLLQVPANEPTLNLDSFSMSTSEEEFHRVVRHETGHTLGCPHEHMRRALVALIDAAKAIKYFMATQGWSEEMVRQQVLTPIEESSLLGTPRPDPNSIMCYQIPGAITVSGAPIVGGLDIDEEDYAFMATVYPKPQGQVKKSSPKRVGITRRKTSGRKATRTKRRARRRPNPPRP